MVHDIRVFGTAAEIVLQTTEGGEHNPDAWYNAVLKHYEEEMDWGELPVESVDVQGGGDEILVELFIQPYFPLMLEKIVDSHRMTLERIRHLT